MVSCDHYVSCAALSAGVIVSHKNSLAPRLVSSSISCFVYRPWVASERAWRVKLGGHHSCIAFLAAKCKTVSTLFCPGQIGRVAQNLLFAKVTMQKYLLYSKTQVLTLARAVIFLVGLYPRNYATKGFAALVASDNPATMCGLASDRAKTIFLVSLLHRRFSFVFLTAIITNDGERRNCTEAITCTASLLFSVWAKLFTTPFAYFNHRKSPTGHAVIIA